VILAAAIDKTETMTALELGARGVILKEAATPLLYRCVRRVMAGEFWVGRDGVADLVRALRRQPTHDAEDPATRLTPRERAVVAAVAEGKSNQDVGRDLLISEQTVKNHLQNIFDKTGVASRVELAFWALDHGLTSRKGPASVRPPR
jgi:DNA-binding NarL/FixJ family response regulator